MKFTIYLILLAPLLPLLGVYLRPLFVMMFTVVAVVAVAIVSLTVEDPSLRMLFLGQLPFCFLASYFGVSLSKKIRRQDGPENAEKINQSLAELRARHADLKAQTARAEQDENQSLQIYGLAKSLAEALSWKDMAPRLATGIQKIFNAHEFLLYSIDSAGQWSLLHRRGSWAKEPPISAQLSAASQFLYPPQTQEVVPVQMVPIASVGAEKGGLAGLLFLKCPVEKPDESLIHVGEEFGEQLGMAINKALLFNQMEINSKIDGLTGVLRRQAFMDRLNDELKRAGAFHTPFCLLMIDIDHFKMVNDGHGHAAGDAVLTRVGQILKEAVYETDVVGRYGGEEFIILLPHAQLDGVMRKAESLRQRFERETISSGFEQLKVTVSIGLAHFPTNGRTAEELIRQADAALYQAKGSGRNRVVAAA